MVYAICNDFYPTLEKKLNRWADGKLYLPSIEPLSSIDERKE